MKRIVVISSIVIVFVFVVLGIGLTTRDNNQDKVPQKTETVKRGDFVIRIGASGNLESLLSVEVKSNVEGEIEKLYVEDGDYIEKGSILLKIDDEQIREEMKQAEANVDAANAQLEQAKRSLAIKEKELKRDLQLQRDNVKQAQMSYQVAKATTIQQISQQETEIQNTQEALEQDKIALRQAEIALKQAELTLSELEQSKNAAKVDLDNAESQLKRNQELYEKEYISKQTLEDAQASYANALSRYERAQKQVLSQKETVNSQKENITARERSIKMREATLKFEENNLKLLKQTRATQEEQALTDLNIAQNRLAQLEENIEDEKAISRFSLESAKANLLRAESTLNNQKERLEWTTISAPMSGIVINLQIEEGEIVTSGRSAFSQSPPIMEIVDLSQMVVKTFINEVDMEKLAVGKKAEIQVRAYSDRIYRGEVREISPSGEARDNIIYFEVLVAVLGSPKELRPGMTADVDIIVLERKNALMLPVEAVRSDRVMTAVLTIPEEDIVRLASRQSVELVLDDEQKFQGTVIRRNLSAKQSNVEIALKDAGRSVRPGRASVDLFMDDDTISKIPAMLRFGRQYYVMLVPKEEKSEVAKGEAVRGVKKLIEVGEQNDVYIEILGGLSEGDKVIVQGSIRGDSGQFGRGR